MYKFSEDANYHPRSRTDDDLWDDEEKENICIRISRNSTKDGNHNWNVFENNNCVFTINSFDFDEEFINLLFTAEGLSFLISQYKKGCNNIDKLKKAVKNHVKNISE